MAYKYEYLTEPFDHQRECLQMSAHLAFFAYLMEMGTGKSKVLIDTVGFNFEQGKVDGLLITCPKGIMFNWEQRELDKHLPPRIKRRIYKWKASPGIRDKARMKKVLTRENGTLNVFIINIDALNTVKGQEAVRQFLSGHNAMWAIDESTGIKNPKAQRTKAVMKLKDMAVMRRIMNGAPITQGPLDLYSQFAFLSPEVFAQHRSYKSFVGMFAVTQKMKVAGNPRAFDRVVGYKNLDQLQHMINPWSYRKLKTECLDLPDKVYQYYDVELTKEQNKMYKDLSEEYISMWGGEVVTVSMALTLAMRLHQIVCGHIGLDDSESPSLIPNNRIKALIDILDQAAGKVVIWSCYRADTEAIATEVRKHYKDEKCIVEFHGGVNDDARAQAVNSFEDEDSPVKYIVCSPQAAGRGLELIQGTTVVYYSSSFSLDDRMQSEDRSHRSGQTSKVTYIDLRCRGTVDEKIVGALRDKRSISAETLGDDPVAWLTE